MIRRRSLHVHVAAAMTLLGVVTAQAPTFATAVITPNAFVTCDMGIYSGTTAVTADPGDPFTLTFSGDCSDVTLTFDSDLTTSIASGSVIGGAGGPLTFLVSPGATGGAHDITITDPTPSVVGRTTGTISVTISGATGASSGDGPASWFKAYQRTSQEAACNAGWHPSYAMWANNNSGGWVCVQELYYSGGSWLTR